MNKILSLLLLCILITYAAEYYISTIAIKIVYIKLKEYPLYLKLNEKGSILNFEFTFSSYIGKECQKINNLNGDSYGECCYLKILHNTTNETILKEKLIEEFNRNLVYIKAIDSNNDGINGVNGLKKRNDELDNMISNLPNRIDDTYFFKLVCSDNSMVTRFQLAKFETNQWARYPYTKKLLLNKYFYIEILD